MPSRSASIWRTEAGALRAPWKVATFGVVVLVTALLLGGVIYALLAATPAIGWAREARIPLDQWLQTICVVAATAVTGRFFGVAEIWRYVGFDGQAWAPRRLLSSGGLGLAIIGIPALLLVAFGAARFEPSTSAESAPFMAWGAAALLVPAALSEELLFRGYAFSVTRDAIGAAKAAVVTSAVFGLAHLLNPGPTVQSVLAVIVAGLFLAAVRVATQSLAAAFAAHLMVNFTQLALLHAPVSGQAFDTPGYRLVPTGPSWLTGGAWGPEGGAAVVAAMLLATFLLRKSALKRTGHG
jgi:membrane protease YdiL (CAAX protease family)